MYVCGAQLIFERRDDTFPKEIRRPTDVFFFATTERRTGNAAHCLK